MLNRTFQLLNNHDTLNNSILFEFVGIGDEPQSWASRGGAICEAKRLEAGGSSSLTSNSCLRPAMHLPCHRSFHRAPWLGAFVRSPLSETLTRGNSAGV